MDSICPLDNRYFEQIRALSNFFSYNSWIKYRVKVELQYFKFLCGIPTMGISISKENLIKFMEIIDIIDIIEIEEILTIEKETLHDIKSIEIYLRRKYDRLEIGPPEYKEYIHFGLTSQDINSLAFSLQLKDCVKICLLPKYHSIIDLLKQKATEWNNIVFMALTHGQPAIPSTLGKELKVFIERLEYCIKRLDNFTYYTKIGGAIGTLAAHYKTFPTINWVSELEGFCVGMGLTRWEYTTQITNYEDIIEISQILTRINNILIDFSQDIWLYISSNIFLLKKETSGQVGSSTMPQKINPINFENAEGNLKLANAGLEFISSKLPISRLQRDLTDSTILRNYGVYIGYSLLSINNIEKGIKKLEPNRKEIKTQLDNHPEILAEAIQCIMRKNGIKDGYEIIRKLTQTHNFENLELFKQKIIISLELNTNTNTNTKLKQEILNLEYSNYLGFLEMN